MSRYLIFFLLLGMATAIGFILIQPDDGGEQRERAGPGAEGTRMAEVGVQENPDSAENGTGSPSDDAAEEDAAAREEAAIEDWIVELLEEARGGNSEAMVQIIFGLANERSPIHEYMRTRTSVEEMIQLLRAEIGSGNQDALIDAAGLLFAKFDMPELQLPGLYPADIEYALREAGRNGNNEAAFMLGLLKLQEFKSTGNEQSRREAMALYERLGETGDPDALAALAYLYAGEERFGVERDEAKLRKYLEAFTEVADMDQASSVGSALLRDSRQPEPDPVKFEMGVRLLAKAGRAGDDNGLNSAAWILATCKGPKPEGFDQAEAYIREHIERHGADAASMDTLAAVEARQGDFAAAMTAQLEAIRLLEAQGAPPDSPTYLQFYERLNEYQNGQAVTGDDYCPG